MNYLSLDEMHVLYKIAINKGKGSWWGITLKNKVYCLICDTPTVICDYDFGLSKHREPLAFHMRKHLKLKAFL